jgi:hypothetical protein
VNGCIFPNGRVHCSLTTVPSVFVTILVPNRSGWWNRVRSPAGPAGRRQQTPAKIDVTRLPDQGVRPRRFVLGNDLPSGPGENFVTPPSMLIKRRLLAPCACVERTFPFVSRTRVSLPAQSYRYRARWTRKIYCLTCYVTRDIHK